MEQLIEIPLSELHDSPFNPRKTYLEIEDLAADIRQQGRVLQPLLVRPRRPNPLRDDIQDGWEIVFGHRRKRGAIAAGLERVHCMVREMTTVEAQRAQISENLQRKDVHPIEEAEGFQVLMLSQEISADQVAEQFGKSRSYVYGRLKLLQACPEIRAACVAGEIGSETALLIARLRTDQLQKKALARIKGKFWDLGDGGKKSFRQIRDLLVEEFTLHLSGAIFDITDATLVANASPCADCPKRTGNAPEFEDVALGKRRDHWDHTPRGADICTDPDCYAAKKAAHLAREAEKLATKGATVVTGNAARQSLSAEGHVKGAYVQLDKVKAELKKLGNKAPKTVLIQDQRTGQVVKAVKRTDLQQAGVAIEAKSTQLDLQEQRKETGLRVQAEANARTQAHVALLMRVRAAMACTPRTEEDLRAAATQALRGVDWDDKPVLCQVWGVADVHALVARLPEMSIAEVTQLLMDCALVHDTKVPQYKLDQVPTELMAAAARYGVDPDAPAESLPTPSEAARAPEGANAAAGGESGAARAPADAVSGDVAVGARGDLVDEMLASTPEAGEQTDDAGAVGAVEGGAAAAAEASASGADACGAPADVATMAMRSLLSKMRSEAVPRASLGRHALAAAEEAGLVDSFTRIEGDSTREISTTMIELTAAGRAWLQRFEVQQ